MGTALCFTAASLGLALLSSPSAASAPQGVFSRGLEHVPLGPATIQPTGGKLTVSNMSPSGDDGVRVLVSEADTFMSSIPLDPAAPGGATMLSDVTGTVGGLQNAPAGRVGLERTPTRFLAASTSAPLARRRTTSASSRTAAPRSTSPMEWRFRSCLSPSENKSHVSPALAAPGCVALSPSIQRIRVVGAPCQAPSGGLRRRERTVRNFPEPE